MNLAARTAASPAGIWALVIVAVAALAFWLGAMMIASRDPGGRRRHAPDMPGPVLGGTHVSDCGRSVAPGWREATFDDREADHYFHVPAARAPADAGTGAEPVPDPGTRVTGVPGQRTGDADRPAKTAREG